MRNALKLLILSAMLLGNSETRAQEMSAEDIKALIEAQVTARQQERSVPSSTNERSIILNNSQDYNKPLYQNPAQQVVSRPDVPVAPSGTKPIPLGKIAFEFGSDRLTSSSLLALGRLAEVVINIDLKGHVVAVVGHTDSVGSATSNLSLSRRRAMSVVRAMTAAGVSLDSLEAYGAGARQPIPGTDPANPANRRVEIVVK